MRKLLKDLGLGITIVSGGIGIKEWVDRKNSYNETLSKIKIENLNQGKTIAELRASKNLETAKYAKDHQDYKEALQSVDIKANLYINEVDKNNGSCTTEVCKKLFSDFQAKLKETEKLAEKVDKNAVDNNAFADIDVTKSSIISDDWIDSYQKFMDSLSDEELLSMCHISFLAGLLIICYNIVMIFYGDYIIKYFSLENKFPKIASFIELRRKFQLYYMTINIIIMVLIILILLILNILVFTGFFS